METQKEFNKRGIPGIIELSNEENIAAWQKLQYGMFIHWGIYSEFAGEYKGKPQKEGYSEQIQMWANIPDDEYLEVAKSFSAEKFDPKEICALAKEAGMKYIVITSKHHDGFSLFDTKTTDYNLVKTTPFAKDAIKMLADECEKQGLKFGLYYSLVDWHQGHEFDHQNNNPIPENIELIIEEQLHELLTGYGPIAEVWFDMSNPTVEQSEKFVKLVRKLQPNAAINGRIWNNKGDFRTLEDNQVPSISLEGAWQTPASIYRETWGYRRWQVRDDFEGKVKDLTTALVRVIARGGNYLLNIGPRGDGSIVEFEADVLKSIGQWLDRHPEALLGAKATHFPEQQWGDVTVNGKNLFLHITNWPENDEISLLGLATDVSKVVEDGTDDVLNWDLDYSENKLTVKLPAQPAEKIVPVIKVVLKDDLFIIPEKTVTAQKDHRFVIQPEDLYSGHSYADEGHYFSLFQTTVRQSAYIAPEREGEVSLTISGVANDHKKYLIEFGNEAKVVTGAELSNSPIGPFAVEAGNNVIPIHMTLAEAEYFNEDLDLKIDSIEVNYV